MKKLNLLWVAELKSLSYRRLLRGTTGSLQSHPTSSLPRRSSWRLRASRRLGNCLQLRAPVTLTTAVRVLARKRARGPFFFRLLTPSLQILTEAGTSGGRGLRRFSKTQRSICPKSTSSLSLAPSRICPTLATSSSRTQETGNNKRST